MPTNRNATGTLFAMLSPGTVTLAAAALVVGFVHAAPATAQSEACEPGTALLGTAGPELCVRIGDQDSPPNEVYFRAPAGPADPPLVIPPTVVGDYTVDMVVTYASGPAAMFITLDGTATRTAPGVGGISVIVNGGWGTPLPESVGSLHLIGFSTGTSLTELGGGAGRAFGITPAQDVLYRGFPQTIREPTFGAAAFDTVLPGQPVIEDAIALIVHSFFHVNEVGVAVDIPGGVKLVPPGAGDGDGDGESKASDGDPHFECYSVEHDPANMEKLFVTLEDQFDLIETRLGKITRLCTPVSKNEEGVPDPRLHLVCYEILDSHDPDEPVLTTNQFGKTELQVRKARELCVPSRKKRLGEEEPEEREKKRY